MTEFPQLLTAYRDATDAFLLVARSAAGDDVAWTTPTDCPGWTVADIVAHVVGLEQDLAGRPRPDHTVPDGLDHVRSDVGQIMEVQVDLRRGRPAASVIAELEEILPERLDWVAAMVAAVGVASADPPEADPLVAGPFGVPVGLSRLLHLRVFDVWAHEQDIRRALGKRGHLAGPAASLVAADVRRSLPYVVAHKAALGAGNVVQLWADGATSVHATVVVDGKGRGRLVDKERGMGLPTVDISMDWETLVRLVCGRASAADVADLVSVDGSRKAGLLVLDNLTLTP